MSTCFEWDEAKNKLNLHKHRLNFEDAIYIWRSPTFTKPDLRRDYGEARFITYGLLDDIVLAVVWTPREGAIRIVSARKARKDEREAYHTEVARSDQDTG